MSKSYDGLQSQDDPLNDQDDSFIIECNGSDSNSKSFDEDHVEYTEEVYLDIDSGDNTEDAVEPELDELFHCSTCDIDFQSVSKHIREFHGDHEVLVDVGNVIIMVFFTYIVPITNTSSIFSGPARISYRGVWRCYKDGAYELWRLKWSISKTTQKSSIKDFTNDFML